MNGGEAAWCVSERGGENSKHKERHGKIRVLQNGWMIQRPRQTVFGRNEQKGAKRMALRTSYRRHEM